MMMKKNTKNSISGVLRLSNESEWLNKCLESILDLFDEILLCTQGEQEDNTIEICKEWSSKFVDKIHHHHYEHKSRPNGPGHNSQPYDIYARSYFYNWCFKKATCEWVCKWDGDMIAMDNCKDYFTKAIKHNASFRFPGIDVVEDIYHVGDREFCASEIRLYKSAIYTNGKNSEALNLNTLRPQRVISANTPLFIHTKWAKSEYAQTQAWPKDWKNIEHFKRIYERRNSKRKHNYELPKCLIQTTA